MKAARSASDLIKTSDESAQKLDDAFSKIQGKYLNEQALTNMAHQIAAWQDSENAGK